MLSNRSTFEIVHPSQYPCKHAGMGQYRASTGLILLASAQHWSGTGLLWHVYGDNIIMKIISLVPSDTFIVEYAIKHLVTKLVLPCRGGLDF